MPKGVDSVLVVKPQGAKGTPAAFAASDYPIPFLSESMQARPTIYQSEALRARALRDRRLARLGTMDVSGSFELEPTNQGLHNLLPLFFPTVGANAEIAPDYDITYTPGLTETDYFTMGIGDGEVTRVFTDCRFGSLALSANINQLARMSVDVMGIDAATNTTPLASTLPTIEYGLYFEQAVVEIGTSGGALTEIPVSAFNISFNKNADGNRYLLGSRFRRDVPTNRWDVTGSVTVDANPMADKEALYSAVLNATWMQFKMTFTDPGNKLSDNTTDSKFIVTVPYALLEWPQHNISGPDYISGGVNFTAFAEGATMPTLQHVYQLDA